MNPGNDDLEREIKQTMNNNIIVCKIILIKISTAMKKLNALHMPGFIIIF